MRKITPQNKAFMSKKAQMGTKKQTDRRLHNKKLKLQQESLERYHRRTRGGEETILL
jgi:hypothetical protein